MAYLHYDIIQKQSSKVNGNPCGDHIDYFRTDKGLHMVLCDGLGSGIKANISARMCSQRIISLMQNGASMRQAFNSVANNMNNIWGKGHPFAVFSIAQILNNGKASVLSYEIPPPIVISKYSAVAVSDEIYTMEKALVHESYFSLKQGEGLMIVSDGITQAGLGCGMANGWEIEGVARYITNKIMTTELTVPEMAEEVHNNARKLWKDTNGDDCSVALAHVRKGISINIISGPPGNKNSDSEVIGNFMHLEGIKVACGGTTSQILARELNHKLEIHSDTRTAISPPKYKIKDIDLVTEGIVTLNQVYNIMGEDTSELADESSVYELNSLLDIADKITFTIGHAENIGSGELQFRQQGILKREIIIPLIIDKLRKAGKLVVLNEI